jgi:hypothetical protein
MGSLSDFAELELLDHVFNAAYTPAANIYMCLCTADPTDAATGASMSEVANAGAYQRTAITFGAAATRRVTQNAEVAFPQATAAWGTVTHWTIADTQTYGSGNVLAHGAFTSSFAPVAGNTPKIASGQTYVEIQATAAGAGFTDYTVENLLDLMFRNQAFSKPATYIALCSVIVADDDVAVSDITEVTGTGYARKQVNINGGASPTWDLAAAGAIDNTHAITFATVGAGGWDEIVACAIVDSASGAGNVLGYDNPNVVDQTPSENDIVEFAIGAFDIALS